jgi:tRNA G18 (ribose-2'-O)-methylase SpoU
VTGTGPISPPSGRPGHDGIGLSPARGCRPRRRGDRLARSGIPVVAADPHHGTRRLVRPAVGVALVIGGEGAGPVEPWTDSASTFVTIPMQAGVESLSVPAAGAVLLFEAARQRRVLR